MTWLAVGEGRAVTIPDGTPVTGAPSGNVIRIDEGTQALPAPILPKRGKAVPALTQAKPADRVSGWVRLRAAGFLANRPNWDGVICAQHDDVTHWLHVSAEELVSTRSFLSLRLIAALGGAGQAASEAIADSMSRPEHLASHLRTAQVTGSGSHITGHLIGAELAAARPYWLGQQVAVIGEPPFITLYAGAIAAQSAPVTPVPAAEALPRGLAALARALGLDG